MAAKPKPHNPRPTSKWFGPKPKGLLVRGTNRVREYEAHRRMWGHCSLCKIGELCVPPKGNHVFLRGVIPCDILFIGEAPGPDENVAGFPFVGRAGSMLDILIETVQAKLIKSRSTTSFTYAIGNTVACLPKPLTKQELATASSPNFRAPTESEVTACRPRLITEIKLAEPAAVVFLGEVAVTHASPAVDEIIKANHPFPVIHIYHPSYLLRKGGKNSQTFHDTALTLSTFIKNVMK